MIIKTAVIHPVETLLMLINRATAFRYHDESKRMLILTKPDGPTYEVECEDEEQYITLKRMLFNEARANYKEEPSGFVFSGGNRIDRDGEMTA